MPSLYMLRSLGTREYPTLAHLKEGRVYDNVSKEDAEQLLKASLAEEFDGNNELHVKVVSEFGHLDARKKEQPVVMKATGKTEEDDKAKGAKK
jgi:hypothetical protein